MPETLDYADPPVYCRRRSARRAGGMMLATAAATAAWLVLGFEFLLRLNGRGGLERWTLYPLLTAAVGIAAAAAVVRMVRGGYWEVRIESGRLYLTWPGRPTLVIPIEDITHFVTLDVTTRSGTESETTRTYELRLRDGRRIPLADCVPGWLPSLRRALRRENPRIAQTRACEDLRWPPDERPQGAGQA